LGYGCLFGGRIKEYLALGYVTVQEIVSSLDLKLPIILQKQGYVGHFRVKAGGCTVIQELEKALRTKGH
jgi:uncharacterized protein YebE (UPF0316 family)